MAGIVLVLCDAKGQSWLTLRCSETTSRERQDSYGPGLPTLSLKSSSLGSAWNDLVRSYQMNDCRRLWTLELSIYTHTFIIQKPVYRDWVIRHEKENKSLLNVFQFPLKDNYEFWVLSFSYSIFISLSGFGMEKVVSFFLKLVAKASLRHEFYSQP